MALPRTPTLQRSIGGEREAEVEGRTTRVRDSMMRESE